MYKCATKVAAYLLARAQAGELRPGVDGPAIIICPATMLSHWLRELHRWAPPLRVIVLHKTARGYHDAISSHHTELDTINEKIQMFLRRWTYEVPFPDKSSCGIFSKNEDEASSHQSKSQKIVTPAIKKHEVGLIGISM